MCLDCLGINKSRLQMFRVFGYLPAHSHHLRQETAVTMVTDRCLSRVDAASSRVVFEKKKKYDRRSRRPRRGPPLFGRIAGFRRGECEQQPGTGSCSLKRCSPPSHQEERLARLHLCTPAGTDVSPTHRVEGDLLSNTRVHF